MGRANTGAMRRAAAFFVLCLLLLIPFGSLAAGPSPIGGTGGSVSPHPTQENPEEGFGRRLRSDLANLIGRPAHMSSDDWRHLGVGVAAVGGTALLDTEIRSRVQRHRTSGKDDFANAIRPLGGWGALAGLSVTWIAGHLSHNPKVQRTAEDGFEASILAAGLITPALKVAAGRARPVEELGAAYLRPFSGHHSFPSGEATEAFAVASVVAAHTKSRWLQGTFWGLAGLVGWERIELDRHWASDVVAGALIGAEVGRWVVKRGTRDPQRRVDVVVLPVIAPGTLAVSGSVSW